ncbi:MAG: hypothetical protein ACKOEO_14355, partial [Planctomycetaceae bacterium]
ERQQSLWQRHIQALDSFLNSNEYEEEKVNLNIATRLESARRKLEHIISPEYLSELHGTLGADQL